MSKRIALALVGMALTWGSAPKADENGFLTVTSTPSAHVFIDDVDTKATTPLQHHALAAGKHKLMLVTDGGTKRTLGVVIVVGQEKKVNVAM
jgi:hypothetical protein